LAGPLRRSLERAVSQHLGRPWTVASTTDLADRASHPAAILSDGSDAVFAKFSDGPNGLEQFQVELAGLRLLAARGGVLTPSPIAAFAVEGGALLVLEAVQPVARTARQWREIGQTLARLHQVKGDSFGFETDGYFGPLPQDNRPLPDWPTFYAERRLRPLLRRAVDSGNLPPAAARRVETVMARLPALCGPAPLPTLLHGDAQQNNFISTAAGAVVIDPAVYYGHPEVDLAMLDYFEPVPEDVFVGYREVRPIDPGFAGRRDLWRIYGYLACVAVDGGPYLAKLTFAVQKYI
jgi:fructosamine-3-kinase